MSLNMSIGGGLYSEVQFEQVWKCLGKGLLYSEFESGALYNDPLEQTDRHDWKHYLPVTSLAGGIKNEMQQREFPSK